MSDDEDEGEDEKDDNDDEAVPPGSALRLSNNKGV